MANGSFMQFNKDKYKYPIEGEGEVRGEKKKDDGTIQPSHYYVH